MTATGWYPDPASPGRERYWEGKKWSHQTRLLAPEAGADRTPVASVVFRLLSFVCLMGLVGAAVSVFQGAPAVPLAFVGGVSWAGLRLFRRAARRRE